jgi:hypothetical protein
LEPAVLTALSAILGSAVGGSATLLTAWLTQRTQGRRERIEAEISKREQLYSEFIAEGSLGPNLSPDEVRRTMLVRPDDPLENFSEACRHELRMLERRR